MHTTFTYDQYVESANFIRDRLSGMLPKTLLLLGSGLGSLAGEVKKPIAISYSEIPNFRVSTAPEHAGWLVCGYLKNKPVLIMQGRLHVYEGFSAQEVAFPIRAARLLGVTSLVVTNAAGGINTAYKPGDLVALTDFVKLSLPNPLTGPSIPEFGPRFCDMSYVFDREYRSLVKKLAEEKSITLHEGVYYYATGPQFETPAEIRAFRTLGGDVVGMSTVHEVIAAVHAGMRVLGISLVTNMAAGVLEQPLTQEEVFTEANKAKEPFTNLIKAFLEKM